MKTLLDDGLDELAASAHAGFAARVAVNLAVAAVFAAILSWPPCALWAGLTVALEAVAWFATRRQFLGLTVGWRTRLLHAGGLLASCLAWVALGAAAWISPAPEGALAAVTLWLTVIFFAQCNAFQSRLGVIFGGVVPAATVLAVVMIWPRTGLTTEAPFDAVLLLAFIFAGEGVARMLRARRRYAEAQERLRRSESLYRMLADNVTDVISLADASGKRHYFSPSIERALGYPVEALYHMPIYAYVHPDDREALHDRVALLAEPGRKELTAEYRVVRADGTPVWVETSFSLADGEAPDDPVRVISVARVIQRRKELEAELIEARRLAEAAAAAKSDFLANMTHELRTPLNAIVGFSGLLKQSAGLTGQDARHAELISEASATLLDLVNTILDFSRLEAGAVELDPAPFDPAAEGRTLVELLSGQAASKGLGLSFEAEGLSLVAGDARRLRQVLLNFLSNAVKFTSEGEVVLRLSGAPAGAGLTRLRGEVRDTGVGLTADQVDKVFERFTQADVSISRRYGGTGLGLAICKRTIELMGGRIGVASIEGQGSTFWFEVDLPTAEGLAAPPEPEAAAVLERPLRLLLAEDVAVNRELVKTLLAPFAIDIVTAEDGVAAIEAFRSGDFDLVLMDVQMPAMDGLTATRRIRALPMAAAATTPIIAMTANVLPEQVAKCLEAGMDGHLGKPMNPAELLTTIAYWSERRREVPPPLAKAAEGPAR